LLIANMRGVRTVSLRQRRGAYTLAETNQGSVILPYAPPPYLPMTYDEVRQIPATRISRASNKLFLETRRLRVVGGTGDVGPPI